MFWTGILIGLAGAVLLGGPVVWLEFKRQVKRARAAERRARQSERLAEIGAMTGGLAHEIKNPLSTIGLNAQLLAEAISELDVPEVDQGRLVRRIDTLRREADRLRDILQDFLDFAGEVHLDKARHDLRSVIEEIGDFFLPQAAHFGVSLRIESDPRPMPADIDARHIKQALLNLLLNAGQAMAARDQPDAARELIIRTEPGPSARAEGTPTWRIHVIDTGPGIPPDVLARIFTPYFTTRSGGSGLGLPTTRRLIEEHSGTIDVHSEPGKGTDFIISIPRAESDRSD